MGVGDIKKVKTNLKLPSLNMTKLWCGLDKAHTCMQNNLSEHRFEMDFSFQIINVLLMEENQLTTWDV